MRKGWTSHGTISVQASRWQHWRGLSRHLPVGWKETIGFVALKWHVYVWVWYIYIETHERNWGGWRIFFSRVVLEDIAHKRAFDSTFLLGMITSWISQAPDIGGKDTPRQRIITCQNTFTGAFRYDMEWPLSLGDNKDVRTQAKPRF